MNKLTHLKTIIDRALSLHNKAIVNIGSEPLTEGIVVNNAELGEAEGDGGRASYLAFNEVDGGKLTVLDPTAIRAIYVPNSYRKSRV